MNCLEFRRSIGAQPNLDTQDVRAHADACHACASYRDELRQMDALIHRALKVDVARENSAPGSTPGAVRRRARYWTIAAGFVVAAGFGLLLWTITPTTTLAEQVTRHVRKEDHALVATPRRIDPSALTAVLERSGVRLAADATDVSYAMSCWFRGHYVPHLVVQTRHGPVTVLVLRHEQAPAHSLAFSHDGYEGVIVPASKGALAVLARGAPVAEAAMKMVGALEYEE